MDIIRKEMDSNDHPHFFKYGKAQRIKIENNGKTIAECAAIYNPRLVVDQPSGMIGFYKSENNLEANKVLFDECQKWFSSFELKHMIGPINYSTWYSNRIQITAFDKETFPGEPVNPEYYLELWSKCGFAIRDKYFTLRHAHKKNFATRAKRLLRSIPLFEEKGYCFESIKKMEVKSALKALHPIMDNIFAKNKYYSSIDFDEFNSIFFSSCHPQSPADVIVALTPDKKICGALILLPFPDFPQTTIVKSIGVAKNERKAATAHALIAKAVLLSREKNCIFTDSALMHSENMSFKIACKIYGEIIKEYAIYGLKL